MHHAHSDDIVYGDGYALIPASRIEPETVDWLWQNRIPRGETIVLEGDPGVGKSILAATLVAAITTGGSMPGGPELDQGFCLIANLEDHRGAVTRPRLEAAGADLDLAIIIKMEDRGYERPVRLPDDLDRIERMIVEKGAELLIVDPLAAALAPDVNMNSDQEVREALGPLAQIGREHGTSDGRPVRPQLRTPPADYPGRG